MASIYYSSGGSFSNIPIPDATSPLAPYPIGSIYTSYENTSPASIFGGTWSSIVNKFLRAGQDTEVGGADTVTLTSSQMPKHTHSATTASAGAHQHSVAYSISGVRNGAYWQPVVLASENREGDTTSYMTSEGAHIHKVTVANTGGGGRTTICPPIRTSMYGDVLHKGGTKCLTFTSSTGQVGKTLSTQLVRFSSLVTQRVQQLCSEVLGRKSQIDSGSQVHPSTIWAEKNITHSRSTRFLHIVTEWLQAKEKHLNQSIWDILSNGVHTATSTGKEVTTKVATRATTIFRLTELATVGTGWVNTSLVGGVA